MKAIVPTYDGEAKSAAVQPVSASSGTTATGAVIPPAGVDGEYVIVFGSRSRAVGLTSRASSTRVTKKTKGNSCTITRYPAARALSATYSTEASYPGRPGLSPPLS